MAVQDLTPQLRTRLSRVERVVGWFIIVATVLLLSGFAYYVYHTAERKGWFRIKIPYHTYIADATGVRVGDKVRLMGFDVGEVTEVTGTEAGKNWFSSNNFNVYVAFRVHEPHYGYVWTDSLVRIRTGDLLGNRVLEITRGMTGEPTVNPGAMLMVLNKDYPMTKRLDYVPLERQPQGPWIAAEESLAFNIRLEQIANRVEAALPSILELTNQLQLVLSNSARLTTDLAASIADARPAITNLAIITTRLTNGNGALGDWLIPTNLNRELELTLVTARSTLATAETNVAVTAGHLNRSLDNLANITSNLNAQVQSNDKILSQISSVILQADQLIQGLKRHWLLRSAFKEPATNQPPSKRPPPPKAGKHRD